MYIRWSLEWCWNFVWRWDDTWGLTFVIPRIVEFHLDLFLYSTELGSILESKFGNWTACILSFLAKDCGQIRTPINGTKHGTKTTYPSRVTVTCNSGFHLRGSSERECMSDGVWSGVEAYCEGNEMKFAKKVVVFYSWEFHHHLT